MEEAISGLEASDCDGASNRDGGSDFVIGGSDFAIGGSEFLTKSRLEKAIGESDWRK